MIPNLHHLELFYYVTKHRGVSAATRHMPYGIQQPAISGQLLQLEETLGSKLFHRRPFALTAVGRQLYEFIVPFFDALPDVPRRLRGELRTHLRLAAPSAVSRRYLPELLRIHKRRYPSLTLQLHDANQAEAEALFTSDKIDIAITELEGGAPRGIRCETLLRLPLALAVSRSLRDATIARLFERRATRPPLIALPSTEAIVKQFDAALARRGHHWPTTIEVSSLDLVLTYVALDLGVGLTVAVPKMKLPGGMKLLPLRDFPQLVLAVLWREGLSASASDFLQQVRDRASELRHIAI